MTLTIQSLLNTATARLSKAGLDDEPGLLAGHLLAHVLDRPRLACLLNPAEPVDAAHAQALDQLAGRLCDGVPLQYVVGSTDFLGGRYKTDPRALIPRPETEELAEAVLEDAAIWDAPHPIVADVGTGSGCIAISLALARPHARLLALDTSPAALELARENAQTLGADARIEFLPSDLLAEVAPETLSAVVSNPPYVSTAEWAELPRHIRDHEPRLALDGGPSGLFLISRLVEEALVALKSGGRIWMEIGEDQGARVRALLETAGFCRIRIKKDRAGHDRMAAGIKP